MDEKLKSFISGIGVMTEVWMISYKGFLQQGLSHTDALDHTKAFMEAMMDTLIDKKEDLQ